MTNEANILIEEYKKKAKEAKNSYEKRIWFMKIQNLEDGICPLCKAELPKNHDLRK